MFVSTVLLCTVYCVLCSGKCAGKYCLLFLCIHLEQNHRLESGIDDDGKDDDDDGLGKTRNRSPPRLWGLNIV